MASSARCEKLLRITKLFCLLTSLTFIAAVIIVINLAIYPVLASSLEPTLLKSLAPVGETQASSGISKTMYRDHLSANQKKIYDIIECNVFNIEEDFSIPTTCTKDEVSEAFDAVRYDRPDIFWLTGAITFNFYPESGVVYKLAPAYSCTKAERDEYIGLITEQAATIYESVKNEDDYTKAKKIWDWICNNTVYDETAENCHTMLGVFKDHRAVCSGYADAFTYLCNKAGIPCMNVVGVADTSNAETAFHAWNAYKIDDTVVYGDITWSDKNSEDNTPVDYSWFCLSKQDIEISHHACNEAVLPEGNNDCYEIWFKNDSFYNSYDENTVCQKLIDLGISSSRSVSIRFSSSEEASIAYSASIGATTMADKLADKLLYDGFLTYKVYKVPQLNAVVWYLKS